MSREVTPGTAVKLRRLQRALATFSESAEALSLALGSLIESFEPEHPGERAPARDVLEKLTGVPKKRPQAPEPLDPEQSGELNHTDLKILSALVQLGGSPQQATGQAVPWPLLSVFTGFLHKTGIVGMSLARMRRAALIEGTSSGFLVTDAGKKALDEASARPLELPRGYKLFEFWCDKLGGAEAKILKAIRAGQSTVLGMGFTHKTGSTGMALAKLKRIKFIEGTDGNFRFTAAFRQACDPTVRVHDTGSGVEHLFDARGVARK